MVAKSQAAIERLEPAPVSACTSTDPSALSISSRVDSGRYGLRRPEYVTSHRATTNRTGAPYCRCRTCPRTVPCGLERTWLSGSVGQRSKDEAASRERRVGKRNRPGYERILREPASGRKPQAWASVQFRNDA